MHLTPPIIVADLIDAKLPSYSTQLLDTSLPLLLRRCGENPNSQRTNDLSFEPELCHMPAAIDHCTHVNPEKIFNFSHRRAESVRHFACSVIFASWGVVAERVNVKVTQHPTFFTFF